MKVQNNYINLKIGLAIIFVIIIIFSVYLLITCEEGSFINGEEQETINKEEAINIKFAHLFRAGTNGEMGIRNSGEPVETFNKGDIFGLAGRCEVAKDSKVRAELLNDNNEVVDENIFEMARPNSSGTFELCCQQVPENPGLYKVKLESDGDNLGLFPFKVSQ